MNGSDTIKVFRGLLEGISEQDQYLSPSSIAEIPTISSILGFLKSPAHYIGKLLSRYQFEQKRISGSRQYLLSKPRIAKILDLYFGTNIMSPNGINDNNVINDTKCVEKVGKMTLGDISDITPKVNGRDNPDKKSAKDAILEFVGNNEHEIQDILEAKNTARKQVGKIKGISENGKRKTKAEIHTHEHIDTQEPKYLYSCYTY